MRKAITFISCAFAACLFLHAYAFAQEVTSDGAAAEEKSEPMVLVAQVNFEKGAIVSQKDNNFTIDFSLTNELDTQPNVKYAVQLINPDGEGPLINERVYDESLAIKKGEVIDREVQYMAPAYLNGTYRVMLGAQNESGLILAAYDLGLVTLFGSKKYAHIEDCVVSVGLEDHKYHANEGVDVNAEEQLTAHCTVISNFENDITVSPQFETHIRSSFGPMVGHVVADQIDITLVPQKIHTISIGIPTNFPPQAYDTQVTLVDEKGKAISDTAYIHFVVAGESATIHNVLLDKNNYQKGETAEMKVQWSGSADNFDSSRRKGTQNGDMTLELSIKDAKNNECSAPFTQMLSPDVQSPTSVKVAMTAACKAPTVMATIKSGTGTVLAQRTFDFSDAEKTTGKNDDRMMKKNPLFWVIIIIVSIIAILAIGKIVRDKKHHVTVGMFLLFFCGTFGVYSITHAGTYCGYGTNAVCATVDLNSCYSPGGGISSPVNIYAQGCTNYRYDGTVYGKLSTEGSYGTIGSFSGQTNSTQRYVGTFSKTAPGSPGGYNANFKVSAVSNCRYSGGGDDCTVNKNKSFTFDVPFSVCAPSPSCVLTFSPSPTPLTIGQQGSVKLTMANDADGQASCSCVGLDAGSGSNINLAAGTYPQSFTMTGTKNCTCTVANGYGASATCPGSITSVGPPCSGYIPNGGTMCTGDDTGLTAAASWHQVSTCSSAQKCEYTMPGAPSCTLTYSPASLIIGQSGSVSLAMANDADGQANCSCVGLDAGTGVNRNLAAGTYPQSFTMAGTKNCTCTVANSIGIETTCSGSVTVSTPSCTGSVPSGSAICPSDDTGLSSTLAWQSVGTSASGCTARKCEYYTPSYSCTVNGVPGNPPANALWCAGDDTGLTANTPWLQVATCTNTRKCEYTMPNYSCTGGNPPYGATWCDGDDTGLTSSLAWQQVSACTNTRKCEYTMPSLGFAQCGSIDGTTINYDYQISEIEKCAGGHSEGYQFNGPNCAMAYMDSCAEWYCTSPSLNWVRCMVKFRPFKGICGSANGGTYDSQPSSNLCEGGTLQWVDTAASDGTWNWICRGSWYESYENCSANKQKPLYDCTGNACASGANICPDDGSGKTTTENMSWVNVGNSWKKCTSQPCECYTPAGTVPSGNEDDDDQGENGRMIETRP